MSAWWTKVQGVTKKHDGPSPMLSAMIRIRFATSMSDVAIEECGIYRRDPDKHPDELNVLPGKIEKARQAQFAKQVRGIMRKGGGR